jgi:hypothetical protein
MAINQGLMMSNEAYARQISELKKTIESTKLLETPPNSRLAYDMLFGSNKPGLEHGFAESIPSTGENGQMEHSSVIPTVRSSMTQASWE